MLARVRSASATDVRAIAGIYGESVRGSVATFDLTDPPHSYWEQRIASVERGDHVLVLERKAEVVGYAYSSAFRSRPGYARTRETSVYLSASAAGVGLGTQIYSQLIALLREDGMHLAVAVIAQPNPASVALHERIGFELVGTLQEVGRKFDRWVDTRWYQLPLEGREFESSGPRGASAAEDLVDERGEHPPDAGGDLGGVDGGHE